MTQEMTQPIEVKKSNKKMLLILSIIFDGIGMLTYSAPIFGEFVDVIWAPISGVLLLLMFKGTAGKIGALIGVAEELLPMTDIIPTFTLTWFYKFVIKKEA